MPERFKKTLFGGGAKSDEGYVVFFNSRVSIEFRDHAGTVFVPAEGLATPSSMAIYPDEMREGRPDGPHLKDDVRRDFVLERIQRAAAFLRMNLM